MTIKLYIDYMSQPSRAVWALCLIAKIPHEVIETKIAKLEMRT
jgi:glutathione S-transferase